MKQWNHLGIIVSLAFLVVVLPRIGLGAGLSSAAADSTDGKPLMLADMGGSIKIISPKDGATLDSGSGIQLKYDVHLSPNGNHLHVYVDGGRPIIDRNVSGCPCTLDLPSLSSGKHTVEVKEATAGHDLTGLQTSVSFTVK